MAAAPPAPPPLACGGSMERWPEGPVGRGSSLLAAPTRLRIVALHSSSFSAAGGKSRSSYAHAKASAALGGGESCMDRDALRLLTTLEGALSRSRCRALFLPASGRAWQPDAS